MSAMITTQKNFSGFTLVEILIVIAIIGVLAAIVIVIINPLGQIYKAKVSNGKAMDAQITHSLEFNAVGVWNFDDSSNPTQAADYSGNNNRGTISGATYNCSDTSYHVLGAGTDKCSISLNGAGNGAVDELAL